MANSDGALRYRVEWKAGDGSYNEVTRSDATATSETITGLDPNTEYTVRVTARHGVMGFAVEGDSAEGSGTTNPGRRTILWARSPRRLRCRSAYLRVATSHGIPWPTWAEPR